MSRWIIEHYDLWRGLHILAVIAWMAGLLYLPRLFAYHTRLERGSEVEIYFQGWERRLLRIIMNGAMVAAYGFGGLLIWTDGAGRMGWDFLYSPPMILKLSGVVLLTGWHHYLGVERKKIAGGTSVRSEKFWRMTNELPFIAAIIMVIAVTAGVK